MEFAMKKHSIEPWKLNREADVSAWVGCRLSSDGG